MKVQADITIVVSAGQQQLAVDVSGVPDVATVGIPYNGVAKASGGTPPYAFSIDSGALPDGIVLNQDGTITGTPLADSVGSDEFVLGVTDAAGAVAKSKQSNKK